MNQAALLIHPKYHVYSALIGKYDHKRDYVGAEGDWKSKYIPKKLKISRVNVNPCAYIHDCDYLIGGCQKCKESADNAFHENMINAVYSSGPLWFWGSDWIRKEIGMIGADTYYFAVDKFGDDAFNFHNNCKHLTERSIAHD